MLAGEESPRASEACGDLAAHALGNRLLDHRREFIAVRLDIAPVGAYALFAVCTRDAGVYLSAGLVSS